MTPARAWAGVHLSRFGATIVVTSAVASALFAHIWVHRFGAVILAAPVAVLLLIPAMAGTGVAVACANPTNAPLPDPPRAALARAAWISGWTIAATAAATAGLLAGPGVVAAPIIRNVVACSGLAVVMVALGRSTLAWLPPLSATILSAMFGAPDDPDRAEPYWWAMMIAEDVTVAMWAVSGGLFVLAASAYVVIPHLRDGQVRRRTCG